MVAGRPPDPPNHPLPESSSLPNMSTPTPHFLADKNGGLQASDPHTQPPTSPRFQKKSFLSITAGSKPPVIPLNRNPVVYKDRPAAVFYEDEICILAKPFSLCLVGKFTRMPKLQEVRSAFKGIGLSGAYEIKWLDYKHVIIHLSNDQDFNRIWTRQQWFIVGQKMRIFKWSPEFEAEKESPVVPVWISFPNLKAHLYEKFALLLIAKTIGRPLFVDEATAKGSRPSVARVCAEYDCRKPPINQVWIVTQKRETGTVTNGYAQKVEFSQMPAYCDHCCHVGHNETNCLVLGNISKSLASMKSQLKGQTKQILNTSKTQIREKIDGEREDKAKGIMVEEIRPATTQTDMSKQSIWRVVGKAGKNGAKDANGNEIDVEKRDVDSVISVSNRFQKIMEAESHEQTRNAKQGHIARNTYNNRETANQGEQNNGTPQAPDERQKNTTNQTGSGDRKGAEIETMSVACPEGATGVADFSEKLQREGSDTQDFLHGNRMHGQKGIIVGERMQKLHAISRSDVEKKELTMHAARGYTEERAATAEVQLESTKNGLNNKNSKSQRVQDLGETNRSLHEVRKQCPDKTPSDREPLPNVPMSGDVDGTMLPAARKQGTTPSYSLQDQRAQGNTSTGVKERVMAPPDGTLMQVSMQNSADDKNKNYLSLPLVRQTDILHKKNLQKSDIGAGTQNVTIDRPAVVISASVNSLQELSPLHGSSDASKQSPSHTRAETISGNEHNLSKSTENASNDLKAPTHDRAVEGTRIDDDQTLARNEQLITVRKAIMRKKAKPALVNLVSVMNIEEAEVALEQANPTATSTRVEIMEVERSRDVLSRPELGICMLNVETDSVPSNEVTRSYTQQENKSVGHVDSPMQSHATPESQNLNIHPCVLRRRKSDSSLCSSDNWNSLNASDPLEVQDGAATADSISQTPSLHTYP
ncbi:Uncharacterized protein TCM_011922 [Theobroma cacao]|uniref:DUF4283 domain-containing protein n=1 Tax=Theobroma cacao TaxID=3641 RepID=A0A061EB82_THECC|nr:Uncharacterized protein TCM_011922 [Theobroma cacao]